MQGRIGRNQRNPHCLCLLLLVEAGTSSDLHVQNSTGLVQLTFSASLVPHDRRFPANTRCHTVSLKVQCHTCHTFRMSESARRSRNAAHDVNHTARSDHDLISWKKLSTFVRAQRGPATARRKGWHLGTTVFLQYLAEMTPELGCSRIV